MSIWGSTQLALVPNCAGNNEEKQMRFGLCRNEEAVEAGTEQENGDGQDDNNYSSFVR